MESFPEKKFSSPEEEITFLREEIARKEREIVMRSNEVDALDHETVSTKVLREYAEHDPTVLLEKKHALTERGVFESRGRVETAPYKVEEFLKLAHEKGMRNALSVLEHMNNAFLTDEVHRALVATLRNDPRVADLREGEPLWNVLSMRLFEIALPRQKSDETAGELKTIFSGMEQFYAGMQTVTEHKKKRVYSLEIALSDKHDDIIFYVAVPNEFVNLFEKQALSLFPNAVLYEQKNDYNIFVEDGVSLISVGSLVHHPIYPLKTYEVFEKDPLSVLLNAFSKIERNGGGASLQVIVGSDAGGRYEFTYRSIIKRMEDGESAKRAIRKSTFSGELFEGLKSMVMSVGNNASDENEEKKIDTQKIELFNTKLESPIVGVTFRLVTSSKTEGRARQILTELESGFNQFENTKGNTLSFKTLTGTEKLHELKKFSFREENPTYILPLSLRELSTVIHFPGEGIESSPQFKQSRAKHAPPPNDMPTHGTLLGENEYRSMKVPIYLTPLDRLRHLYVIGQTGVGKTTLIKNMINQDIREGAGVCYIDPHGTDIVDVLASVPSERMNDVIYFDPSNMDTVMGLNMLEYDERHPEQKTFVVNELFSIFQKLYGGNPESMGPMFEQYFRNATLLVLDDPESGSTLLDISRVMVDDTYRRYKLSKATNPVAVQFWKEIATKASGDASLANIVPYIVSKFDVFTANDYMRPIIGQQKSSFNFRDIMDSKKILLVNLAKGRLGEINANLIGMIIVGKILMAALSRVDDLTQSYPPFYLYIDEFQNITTNSIASILSEARKYKLGLTVAHQFIAQIDEGIRDAVFGNVGSMAAFRVGPEDATFLEKQFAPAFTASDLMNIENQYAYVRILANGSPTPPFSLHTLKPHPTDFEYARELMEYSSLQYGTSRSQVDAAIRSRYLSA